MPRLSDTMERGTVARWLKQEGDTVRSGEIVAEIETDKATMDYQSDVDGVLLKILVGDGETAELGDPIGYVGEQGEAVPGGSGGDGAGAAAQPGPAAEADATGEAPAAAQAEAATKEEGAEAQPAAGGPAAPAADGQAPESAGNGRGGPLRV